MCVIISFLVAIVFLQVLTLYVLYLLVKFATVHRKALIGNREKRE